MADPNLSELASTTLQLLEDELVDNVTDNNALLRALKEEGNVKTYDGGEYISQPIEYTENSTYQRIAGWEQINITPSTVISAARFQPKQVFISVAISGAEELANSGRSRKIDLLKARVKNAMNTFENNFNADLFSAGTSDSGKQIGGLQLLVADAPTSGVVGGINRATWSFWQNATYDFSDAGVTASASTIQAAMAAAHRSIYKQGDNTTLILADDVYFGYFEDSLMAIQRITQEGKKNSMADAGFQSYLFKGIPVVLADGLGGDCPASHMYFLNTKYLYLRPHKDRNLKQLNPDRYSVNQDGFIRLIGWHGNLTISNCRQQLVMKA